MVGGKCFYCRLGHLLVSPLGNICINTVSATSRKQTHDRRIDSPTWRRSIVRLVNVDLTCYMYGLS